MCKKRLLLPLAVWFVCYMAVFGYLEVRPPVEVHLISSPLDSLIPYVPVFIYPYLGWFPYICICAWLAFFNLSDKDYKKSLLLLTMGMNLFLAVSLLWPTGLTLREGIVYDEGRLSGILMRFVQTLDAPKSVFPSMHVYVTLVLQHSLELQKDRLPGRVLLLGRISAVLIILSTMFTKQHSVIDVAGAILMFLILRALILRLH